MEKTRQQIYRTISDKRKEMVEYENAPRPSTEWATEALEEW